MTPRRMIELQREVTITIAQEARHLADTADFDAITRNDEEDEFIRAELRRQADVIESQLRREYHRTRKVSR